MKVDALHPEKLIALTDDIYENVRLGLKVEDAVARESQVSQALVPLHPADIADLIERFPQDVRVDLFHYVAEERRGDVLAELGEGAAEHLLQNLEKDEVKAAISELESDDAVDLALQLEEADIADETTAKEILSDKQQKRLLQYDPETAGGLMQLEVLTALPEQTVGDVFKYLRKKKNDAPENPGTVFILNERRKLLGTMSITRMVQGPLNKKLADVMREEPLSVTPDVSQDDVSAIFEKYDIHNLAVVNKRKALLGRITIDDVLDAMRDAHDKQLARAAGVDEGEDLFAPAHQTTRQRLPWLVVNLFTAILASLVIALFQNEIEKLVALAVLMPIVASMGGNAATQTMTVTVRGLATGQITMRNALLLLSKEMMVGSFNGIFLAFLLALGTFAFYGNTYLAVVIGLATIANHIFAALAGHVIPLVLKRLKYDPAISSGVLVTTVTDVGGFFVFLGLAALLLL